jgi:hypothetical protein
MKKQILKYSFLVTAFFLLFACKKESGVTNQAYNAYGVSSMQGQLKINLAFAYTINYNTMLIKINGNVVSNALATRTPFPGGGYNTNGSNYALYLNVPIGSNAVSVVIPKVGTNADSVVLYNTTVNIPDNAPYTLHIADTASNTRSLLVKNYIDNLPTDYCRYRFVNLIPNMPNVDLYKDGVLMQAGIAYMASSGTFEIPYTTGTPSWTIRANGAAATSAAVATYASTNTLQRNVVLTVFAMGYNGQTTGTRIPYLSFTLDKNQ